MTLTTHVLTGAVIGTELNNPYAIAATSLAVHFLIDSIPHADYIHKKSTLKDSWKIILDLAVGLLLIGALFAIKSTANLPVKNILIAIFFSLLPDLITFFYCHLKMKFLRPIKIFHENIHFYKNSSPKRQFNFKNSYLEIIISIASLGILFLPRL